MKDRIYIALVLTCLTLTFSWAQTPGEIVDDAPLDVNNILDPNSDGFVSDDGLAFTTTENFEYNFIPIPQVTFEDAGDATGGTCGNTDIVDNPGSMAEASYVIFLDPDNIPDNGDEALIYRMRIANNASGAFGFSVLIDTDGNIGTDDPNFISGNPGFEFEVRYISGGGSTGVQVSNVDGNTDANFIVNNYDEDANSQRANALFTDSDCPGGRDQIFYDFWIPLADLGVTSGGQIRLAAATSQSPGGTVLDGRGADLAGIDDSDIGGLFPTQDDAFIAAINIQNPTPISNLDGDGCFIEGTSDAPTINEPIFESDDLLAGTSTEPNGAFLEVLINNQPFDTVLVSGGIWTVNFSRGTLVSFDKITITVQDSCEYESSEIIAFVRNDGDSDNDGILDVDEGNGTDPGGDTDGDGISNYLDTSFPGFVDSNNDGVNDNFDADLDGIPNHFDLDSDNDGITDLEETGGGALDLDNDGVIDNTTDVDLDGIPDVIDEDQGGTALTSNDTDGDGVSDAFDLDADGDGLADIIEAGGTDANNDGKVDSFVDSNGDGLNDVLSGAPLPNLDSDNDGNPNSRDIDSDDDGIPDIIEIQSSLTFMSPTGIDSDGDGIDDTYDPDNGGTVLNPENTDGIDAFDYLDDDSDNDGVLDNVEGNDANFDGVADISPSGNDTDGDGLDDNFDNTGAGSSNALGSNAALQDLDGDGIPNYRDSDDDGDGTPTSSEDGGNGVFTDDFTQGGGIFPDYLYAPDFDGDGIDDNVDLDSDNDGTLDTDEDGNTGFDPTGDDDGDGILNYVDASQAGLTFTDSNGDGINDAFDFDLDGIPDFQDRDSDGDGISDLIESGGNDVDGNGQLDSFSDLNMNGLDDTLEISPLIAIDTDMDGIEDRFDADSDGDGIPDLIEAQTGGALITLTGNDADRDGIDDAFDPANGGTAITSVSIQNTDGTGLPDYRDTDSDGDGVLDLIEGNDFNMDGIADIIPSTNDADGDGISDEFDTQNGRGGNGPISSSVVLQDTDGNGVADFQDNDDDGDGVITGSGVAGSGEDRNGNGDLSDDFSESGGTIPDYLFDADFDDDGVGDISDLDSDNDGILDANEDGGSGFDPTGDADGDGILNFLDQSDVTAGFPTFVDTNGDNINDIYDSDLDGTPDYKDLDSDNDGLLDIIEAGGTDADSDGQIDGNINGANDDNMDGIDDTIGVAGLTPIDTDMDGNPDFTDLDSDNDGIPDLVEAGQTDADGNGIVDDFTDGDNDGIADIYDTDSGGTPITPIDSDGDGLADNIDLDANGDGIPDILLIGGVDTNEDGQIDSFVDTDGDGLADTVDPDNGGTPFALSDTDGDGILDHQDSDSDGDGIPNSIEAQAIPAAIVPSGFDSDGDGIDDNFDPDNGGSFISPLDTDGDGIFDLIDTDSDADGISDLIEGNDANMDGVADTAPSGLDTDGDGLDDAFDTDNGGTLPVLPDSETDGRRDFRDNDDDDDGILTIEEPLDVSPTNGTPDYLENNVGDCGTGFVTVDFNGNADAVSSATSIDFSGNALGVPNDLNAVINNNGILVLDLSEIIPQSFSITIRFQNEGNNGTASINVESSLDNITFGDLQNFTTPNNNLNYVSEAYTVLATNGVRYLRISETGNRDIGIDGISYAYFICELDRDNDGVSDVNDNDDDNDGIADLVEAGGFDPSADDDGDGIPNYQDSDFSGFVDANLDGVNDNFDFDLDGVPNHFDRDSDNDGISDAVEANGGSLPDPNMTLEGAFTISFIQNSFNDVDGDGLADIFDPTNGGTALNPVNSDMTGLPDYLDNDADDDGQPDYIEGFDDNGNGNAFDDILTRAQNFEASNGNPGIYPDTDTDGDGLPDFLEDNDGDGIPNYIDPGFLTDSDNDGIIDLFDVGSLGQAASLPDNDMSGSPDYIEGSAVIVLPVELLSFQATSIESGALLSWQTATELNNEGFEIQRSINPNNGFEKVGFLKGNGTSTELINYEFEDNSIQSNNTYYYRLKNIDFDGQFELSKIVSIRIEKIFQEPKITVYPNPLVKGSDISFNLLFFDESLVSVEIRSIEGTLVFNKEYIKATDMLTIDGNELILSAGIYIMSVTQGANTVYNKLIVQE